MLKVAYYILMRYGGVIAFILFEIISIRWVVTSNDYQKEIFVASSNYFSGQFYKKYNNITQYVKLKTIADSLAKDNADIYNKLYRQSILKMTKPDSLFDSVAIHYTLISAEVINNNIYTDNNHFTISKGLRDGIRPGMGVVDVNGIVGVVRHCTQKFSQVISVLNDDLHISAAIKNSNHFGTIGWNKPNLFEFILEDIPKHTELHQGDSIITSGYSQIFPKGITIGVIDSFWVRKGGDDWQILVRSFNDLSNMNYVYVIQCDDQQEIKSVEKEVTNE